MGMTPVHNVCSLGPYAKGLSGVGGIFDSEPLRYTGVYNIIPRGQRVSEKQLTGTVVHCNTYDNEISWLGGLVFGNLFRTNSGIWALETVRPCTAFQQNMGNA